MNTLPEDLQWMIWKCCFNNVIEELKELIILDEGIDKAKFQINM